MTDSMIRCPFCAEAIRAEARKCKHCGEFLPGHSRGSVLASLLRDMVDFITTGSTRRRLRTRLAEQMGSREHGTALRAVEQLRTEGWLGDGSLGDLDLHGANLEGANMVGAHLKAANLSRANLRNANLEGAWLGGISSRGTRLDGADLRVANLRGALLAGANLRGADLREADLGGAFLFNANFEGADLRGANLDGARLEGARLKDANLEGLALPEARPADEPPTALPQATSFLEVPRDSPRKLAEGWRVVLVPWEADHSVIALEVWGDAEIGRSYEADINLVPHQGWDNGVSRRHAQLSATQTGIFLDDLGSTNGTYVNANRAEPGQPFPLGDGDIVRFGLVSFDLHVVRQPGDLL
jgi:uncharacterized protein YjbI with pentapeptide repeats